MVRTAAAAAAALAAEARGQRAVNDDGAAAVWVMGGMGCMLGSFESLLLGVEAACARQFS